MCVRDSRRIIRQMTKGERQDIEEKKSGEIARQPSCTALHCTAQLESEKTRAIPY